MALFVNVDNFQLVFKFSFRGTVDWRKTGIRKTKIKSWSVDNLMTVDNFLYRGRGRKKLKLGGATGNNNMYVPLWGSV